MMTRRLKLESFGPEPVEPVFTAPQMPDVEDIRLKAYEQGYSAGWDDAVRAQSDDGARIREDLARNLRELSFTFHEARTHIMRSLEPLLEAMVTRILPRVARDTLGKAVVEEVLSSAEATLNNPIHLAVSAADYEIVQATIASDIPFPLEVVVDPLLGEGQVHFRFDDTERSLDTASVVEAVQALVEAFIAEPEQKVIRHG